MSNARWMTFLRMSALTALKYNCILDFQDSLWPEKQPPPKRKKSSASNSPFVSKKRKGKSTNPIQSLADALVGFSEVYARIDIAMMEMFTKLVLELAKLHTKKRRGRIQLLILRIPNEALDDTNNIFDIVTFSGYLGLVLYLKLFP